MGKKKLFLLSLLFLPMLGRGEEWCGTDDYRITPEWELQKMMGRDFRVILQHVNHWKKTPSPEELKKMNPFIPLPMEKLPPEIRKYMDVPAYTDTAINLPYIDVASVKRNANMQDFAIRYPTSLLRLALLLAVVESSENISIKNMNNAVKLMHYFMASAKRCNDAMRQTNIPDNARKIISYWHRNLSDRPRPVSIRELENSIGLLKSEVEEALQVLTERNYCRYLPQESNDG